MGTNCAPLIGDLILFCYKSDFLSSLPSRNQTNSIEA